MSALCIYIPPNGLAQSICVYLHVTDSAMSCPTFVSS